LEIRFSTSYERNADTAGDAPGNRPRKNPMRPLRTIVGAVCFRSARLGYTLPIFSAAVAGVREPIPMMTSEIANSPMITLTISTPADSGANPKVKRACPLDGPTPTMETR